MKTTSIKILLAVLSIGAMSSCNSEGTEAEMLVSDEVEKTIETKTEVKQDAEDGPFNVKSGIVTYESKKLDGSLVSTSTFYFDDYGNLVKLEETAAGETSVYMYDQKASKGMTAFPGRKPSKISMRQGELNMLVAKHSTSGYVQQNNEAVAGKDCIVYANNAQSAEGESKHIYWKYKGVLLKEINRLGTGYMLEATSFEEKALDNDVFSELDAIK
jgi:hypothetical protein